MAPRMKNVRKRKELGTSSSQTEDNPILVERHHEIAKWATAHERGIHLSEHDCYRKYHVVIHKLGWEYFVAQPVKPCVQLVHEFYAQLPEAGREEVKIFGKTINFGPDAINSALRIHPPDGPDLYTQIMNEEAGIDEKEIIQVLTLGTGGKNKRRRGPFGLFSQGSTLVMGGLSEEAKFWRKFMNGRLLGTTKGSESSKAQQAMLYCILRGEPLNVGLYIYRNLDQKRQLMRDNKIGKLSLAYPSLITQLCAAVPRQPGWIEILTMGLMDGSLIAPQDETAQSSFDFWQENYGNKGQPGWVPPSLRRIDPANSSDDDGSGGAQQQQGQQQGTFGESSEVRYSVPLSDWTDMRDAIQRQDQRYEQTLQWQGQIDDRVTRIEQQQMEGFARIDRRQDEHTQEMRGMHTSLDALYAASMEYYSRFPPPQ